MRLNTVIFDMDGLLIDSEPLWSEAADEVFKLYGFSLSQEQYNTTTGLRTREFVEWWFKHNNIDQDEYARAGRRIVQSVIRKVERKGKVMPGVQYIFDFFQKRNFKIGLATSSPIELIDVVVEMTGIKHFIKAVSSAEDMEYGKPHPQVYLNCATLLESDPAECICFEDSFNGMIAAKAARMKCVVVPPYTQLKDERWGAADLKLSSLQNFGELLFNMVNT